VGYCRIGAGGRGWFSSSDGQCDYDLTETSAEFWCVVLMLNVLCIECVVNVKRAKRVVLSIV
jgi:hypothetical protein